MLSSLVDIYRDFTTSPAGISLFVAVTGVLVAGTYVMLKMTGDKIRGQNVKQTHENKIAKGVWAIYYLMIAIMAFVILQLLFFSQYYAGWYPNHYYILIILGRNNYYLVFLH